MSNTAEAAPAAATKAPEVVEIQKSILDELLEQTSKHSAGREQFVIIPKTFEEAEKYAEFISKSQLLPKGCGKNDVFLMIQAGLEHGLSPMQALKGMFVVNNRVSIFGDLALALVIRSKKMDVFDEDNAETALKQKFGRCRVKRAGTPPCRIDLLRPEIKCLDAAAQKPRECCIEHRFTMEQASTAGLAKKEGPWTNYPGRMLAMRARSWALRDGFSDVLMGLSVMEEERDIPTPHTDAALAETTIRMPQRKSDAAKETVPLVMPDSPQASVSQATEPSPAPTPQPPQPEATEGTGEFLLEKIEVVGYKDKKSGADKKFYKITAVGNQGFATFSDSEADIVRTAISTKSPVSITWKRSPGKENLAVKSLSPVVADAQIPDEPGANG